MKIIQNKWVPHLLFWMISYYILVKSFAQSGNIHHIDYVYTLLFHLLIIPVVYINLIWLIPKLVNKQHYISYLFSVTILISLGSYSNRLFFNYGVDILVPDYYFIANFTFFELVKYYTGFIVVTSMLKLSRDWFRLSKNEKQMSLMKEQKTRSELDALRSQINPHFLFNSLNNLYALSLKNDHRTSQAILKLSDSLRYMLYEANVDFIDIADEINFIKNYIDLQHLRIAESNKVLFEITGSEWGIKIAPLLMIPLVENSFKYGTKQPNGYINIKLDINDSLLSFYIENDVANIDEPEVDPYKGIGLTNLSKRLMLIYPNRHDLIIKNKSNKFSVSLTINLT